MNGTSNPTRLWFRRYRTVSRPRLCLVCLPHAGGTPTAYRSWADDRLGADVEVLAVCYPGRQDRFGEPFSVSIEAMAWEIMRAMRPLADIPVALFGHSMGALVAYELARLLDIGQRRSPVRVFVSGSEAPHRVPESQLSALDDAAFFREIQGLGSSRLKAVDDPVLLELVLPIIRADYRLVEAYHRPMPARLLSPVVAYVGDEEVRERADIEAWSEITETEFSMRVFAGGHFYLERQEDELLEGIAEYLGKDLIG